VKCILLFLTLLFCSPTLADDSQVKVHVDQKVCQAKANYMAKHNVFDHYAPIVGWFEGIGYGSVPNCGTCTPSQQMRLTGDAVAKSASGAYYRVRSWR